MGELLERRRRQTEQRIQQLRSKLQDAAKLCSTEACIYVTGSFGRGEASRYSDLDLFIAGKGTPANPAISRLNEILIKADLIEATRELGFPPFSGDGEYLKHYTVEEIVETLGTPEDDVTNTFTARLLLLLESYPLVDNSAYQSITTDVISAYWGDYQDHKRDFMPAFLANDVLRMWRTFCVNYEARTQREPEEAAAKRRLKNYKLKHSRLLTCYSALLYLLAIFILNKTVSPTDAATMTSLSPTKRLEWLRSVAQFKDAHTMLDTLISRYENFLSNTDVPEADLINIFLDKDKRKAYFESAYQFGDLVFEVLNTMGRGNRFHRLLVV